MHQRRDAARGITARGIKADRRKQMAILSKSTPTLLPPALLTPALRSAQLATDER